MEFKNTQVLPLPMIDRMKAQTSEVFIVAMMPLDIPDMQLVYGYMSQQGMKVCHIFGEELPEWHLVYNIMYKDDQEKQVHSYKDKQIFLKALEKADEKHRCLVLMACDYEMMESFFEN